MKKIQNKTLQTFIDIFVQELKRENDNREYHKTKKLSIPFILSSLYQSFSNNSDFYKEFISDLEIYPDYNIAIDNPKNDYDGIIDVKINLVRYKDEDESLSITFLTIFIGTMGTDKEKGIRLISLIATVLIFLAGIIIYTVQGYDISVDEKCYKIYVKIMFGCIGLLSLILSILYVKRISELK